MYYDRYYAGIGVGVLTTLFWLVGLPTWGILATGLVAALGTVAGYVRTVRHRRRVVSRIIRSVPEEEDGGTSAPSAT